MDKELRKNLEEKEKNGDKFSFGYLCGYDQAEKDIKNKILDWLGVYDIFELRDEED